MSEASAHQRRIDAIMAKAYRREGHTMLPAQAPTPVDAMMAAEQDYSDEERQIREEAVAKWRNWIMEDGCHPAAVMKRFFVFLRATAPESILNMPGTDIAAIFGQGRAAESARCGLLLGQLQKKSGYKSLTMPFQKSATAKKKYAEAARGNRNRANSVRREMPAHVPVSGKPQRAV